MRTIRTKVCKFNELSETAQQKAIEKYRSNNTEIFWADENRESMEEFAKLFPITVKRWSYGDRGEGVYFSFDESDEIENLTGQRLATYIWNNYKDYIYSPKQYWICQGRHNTVGANAKHRDSKIFLYEEFYCPLTGYCMDNEIIAPLYEFMRKPCNSTNFKDLLQDCFDSWVRACDKDIDYQNSDEYITETIEANEYEFTVDGRMI